MYQESLQRRYDFDISKIAQKVEQQRIQVTRGQLAYEMEHLKGKLKQRSEADFNKIKTVRIIKTHPMFDVVAGKVEDWEKIG
jgi:hypothetical protein